MVSIAVFIGALVAGGFGIFDSPLQDHVFLACVVAFLFTGAGNSLNDYYDRHIDKINHPRRPIPAGKIQPENVASFAFLLFSVSVILALFINIVAFLIVVANLIVMLSYEVFSKARGISGNMTISWLTATSFLFGGAAVMLVEKTVILAAMAFLATLGREIAKDIEDIKGDEGRFTLPMKVGPENAGAVASTSIASAVLLSPLPIMLEMFSGGGLFSYLPLIAITNAIFLYCIFLFNEESFKVSEKIKYGMLMALLAFLAGGILSV
jgi:geranylgeranylglycerol-phosphate geranylgeranyltransferase